MKFSLQKFTPKIASFLIRALASTWNVKVSKDSPYSGEIPTNGIFAFWHDEMLPVWRFLGGANSAALVSKSSDGEILSTLLTDWNFGKVVRGSSSQGGKDALQEIISLSKDFRVLLTPDGPKGPRHMFKAGAVVAAARAQKPLFLIRIKTSGFRFAKSWDNFLVPYPWASIELFISQPHFFESADRDLTPEIKLCQQQLETLIGRLTQ